ncbi:Cation-transporting P-type ATPase [Carpediemonas membranifera]|uniref:Cation-transporting P-type ATPase n=1 Tax=Carpediemonas membranifera TaxID=201153 RepID=A0A8J6E4B5_9EUKA|nr:Cation-transporting P-type ATPase [Carpediemonas membranifera]|eukprot:KAG9396998.1 Cation-transporting P-type ATPase [Carpediemonas membranifera]
MGFSLNLASLRHGRAESEIPRLREEYGTNSMDTHPPSLIRLLVTQVIHPFYLFQVVSFIFWAIDDYLVYACCILLISTFSAIVETFQTRRSQLRLYKMARQDGTCTVIRRQTGGISSVTIPVDDIVPGDLVRLYHGDNVPCDIVLTSGDVVVNEATLTGESTPTLKTPLIPDDEDEVLDPDDVSSRHVLYSGTTVVQTRTASGHAYGISIRTGFSTAKGKMIMSIMNPPEKGAFTFYRDSIRFLFVMCGLSVIGFLVSLYFFIKLHVSWKVIALQAGDIITIVVPPALPACMSVGTSFAMGFLRKKHIQCVAPQHINVAGKVKTVVFDKTGTLTEDHLALHGVIHSGDSAADQPTPLMRTALACCHTLATHDGGLIGDVLEQIMLHESEAVMRDGHQVEQDRSVREESSTSTDETSQDGFVPIRSSYSPGSPPESLQNHIPCGLKSAFATPYLSEAASPLGSTRKFPDLDMVMEPIDFIAESSVAAVLSFPGRTIPDIHVVRRFPFESSLQRMSVVVCRPVLTIFTKGSPERIISHCDPATIPSNLARVLEDEASAGRRVIAVAYKDLDTSLAPELDQVSRAELEADLTFVGLVSFVNPLREDTLECLGVLRRANIRTIMCTGDNPHTAVAVARHAGMITDEVLYVIPDDQTDGVLVVDSPDPAEATCAIDPSTLEFTAHSPTGLCYRHDSCSSKDSLLGASLPSVPYPYALVVTGSSFDRLLTMARKNDPPRSVDFVDLVCARVAVFARMTPENKADAVRMLQKRTGVLTAMIGDGANDCNSLKAADVGISLSSSEASIAAPFTSTAGSIRAVIDVLRHGRCALVTSFQAFKYMALYSMIQFISVISLYRINTDLSNGEFIYIDLFLILPLAFSMSRAKPVDMLVKRTPPAKLVGGTILSSLLGQILIVLVLQVVLQVYVVHRPWYVEISANPDTSNTYSMLVTTVFCLSATMYLSTAVSFSLGRPWRQGLHRNFILVASVVVLIVTTAILVLGQLPFVLHWMEMTPTPLEFRVVVFIFAVLFVVLSVSWEAVTMQYRLYSRVKRLVMPRKHLRATKQRSKRIRLIERHLEKVWDVD